MRLVDAVFNSDGNVRFDCKFVGYYTRIRY